MSSSAPALAVRGLGKTYSIVHNAPRHTTIREAIVARLRQPLRRADRETFWALQDVTFDVHRGQILGVIGRNGAGKSTLLKILSRITEPTSGEAHVYGRVGTLLEVGTGFHPELTGRENIYLNGAILGMTRREIAQRFDEIVEFAEVERFLDTPVKRYSSGMYVRLAFAVAAHLRPEILLVDEVLAVGDASFQKKCLGKMADVAREGRTVVFVSHDMAAVTRLCPTTLLLNDGRVVEIGQTHDVVRTYLQSGLGTRAAREWPSPNRAPGNHVARLRKARVCGPEGRDTEVVDIRKPVGVEMIYDVLEPGHVLVPNFHFTNQDGVRVFVAHDADPVWRRTPRPPGRYASTAWIPGNLLAEGTLLVGVALSTHDPIMVHFYERDALAFQVVDSLDGDTARGDYAGPMPGVVRPLLEWTTELLRPADAGALSLTEVGR